MRRWSAATLTVAFCLVGAGPAHTAAPRKVTLTVPGAVKTDARVVATVKVPKAIKGALVARLERADGTRWRSMTRANVKSRKAQLRFAAGPVEGALRLRVVILRGKRVVARSSVKTLRVKRVTTTPPPGVKTPPVVLRDLPPPGFGTLPPLDQPPVSSTSFTVPANTRVYEPADIVDSAAANPSAPATVTTGAGVKPPVVGGHVALAPTESLPYGMLASVTRVTPAPGGGVTAALKTAPLDEVFDNVDYRFDGPVTPILVDEHNHPVPGAVDSKGGVSIRGSASNRPGFNDVFKCQESGGLPRNADDMWRTGLPLPIEIRFENTNVIHNFDKGSLYPRREPSMMFQLSGEVVASIGFEAKTGFKCELSETFRRNHRLVLPLKNIGPIPVSIYFEPRLTFEVSASGKFELSQRHYFARTVRKTGLDPLQLSRAGSADPVQLSASARVGASLFVGGDLNLMLGSDAGAFGLGAGLTGSFGPEFFAETTSASPGCLNAGWRLKAALALKLAVWAGRWSSEETIDLGSLTTADQPFSGSPYCALPEPPPPTGPPPTEPAPSPEPFPDANGTLTRVSVSDAGVRASGHESSIPFSPALSRDGRYVAFVSRASNLVPGDTNDERDVFVRDTLTQSTERINRSTTGGQSQGNGGVGEYQPVAISADGRFVAFSSAAPDLVASDTNGTTDVFVRDRSAGTTERVSVSTAGAESSGYDAAISADGRFVAFTSGAANLVPHDTNGELDVFVHDRQTRVTQRVSVTSSGGQADSYGYYGSRSPILSADGRYVAFQTHAGNIVSGPVGEISHAAIHDRVTGLTTQVDVGSFAGPLDSTGPEGISANGRYVTFTSRSSGLVDGDTNGARDVFVRDRIAGVTQRVSLSPTGAQATGDSGGGAISADGRYVVFLASADLDGRGAYGVYVHDRTEGRSKRVSLTSTGSALTGEYDSAITADGRSVAFVSSSGDFGPDARQLYARDRGAPVG